MILLNLIIYYPPKQEQRLATKTRNKDSQQLKIKQNRNKDAASRDEYAKRC